MTCNLYLFSARYHYKLHKFWKFFRVSRLRPAWDRRSFDAPKIVAIHFAVKSPSRTHRQRRMAKKSRAKLPRSFRSITIPVAGGPENRRRSISACTDQKMIGAASQNAGNPRPFERSRMHLGEKQRANASGPTSVTRNATFEVEAFSSMRSFLRSSEHKRRFAPRNGPMRKM